MRYPAPALGWFTYPDCYVSAILLVIAGFFVFSAVGLRRQQTTSSVASFPLDSVAGLEVMNGKADVATYRGRRGVHLTAPPGRSDPEDNESVQAFVAGFDFRDGTIEADVAGAPLPGSPADARGFIGIDFRSQEHGARTESIYLRPTNGRADDQLRRNHSVQYDSMPDFSLVPPAKREPRSLRILHRSRSGRVDAHEDRGFRDQGSAVRQWQQPAVPDRKRSEARRNPRAGRPLGTVEHGRVLFQADYTERSIVSSLRFANAAAAVRDSP